MKKTTTYQRILEKLIEAQKFKLRYKRHGELLPAGWVPADVFLTPSVGGVSALRRLRELRHKGFRIEWRYYVRKDGTTTHTTIYRLITPHQNIDLETVSIKQQKHPELF